MRRGQVRGSVEEQSHSGVGPRGGANRDGISTLSSSLCSRTNLSGGEDVRVVGDGVVAKPWHRDSRLHATYARLSSLVADGAVAEPRHRGSCLLAAYVRLGSFNEGMPKLLARHRHRASTHGGCRLEMSSAPASAKIKAAACTGGSGLHKDGVELYCSGVHYLMERGELASIGYLKETVAANLM